MSTALCIVMRLDEAQSLRRIVEAAREVEAYLAEDARQARCDVVNDAHEELRCALHTLDTLPTGSKAP